MASQTKLKEQKSSYLFLGCLSVCKKLAWNIDSLWIKKFEVADNIIFFQIF